MFYLLRVEVIPINFWTKFLQFLVNIYLNFLDDYANAQKKCNVAKSKSDLSSAEEISNQCKKRKKKKEVSSSESGMFYILCFILYLFNSVLD